MKVLIIGATGSIGRVVSAELLKNTDAELVLAARHISPTMISDTSRETAINLDVTNDQGLVTALDGIDFVFAALSGRMNTFAKHLVKVMDQVGVKRLAFITTMGIYQEIPSWLGESPNPYHNLILRPYRKAADTIENSDLDYTIIRPGWLDNGPADYELTKKGEPFGGHDVSRYAIADLVIKMVKNPEFGNRESFGINRPQAH
ncbi:MAG TPA: NAD(P)H-binding protein [Candidatus Limosilactobacillus excrementigallinarum]|nr:NAD(P)H-binding protein [Candidatus Limosilactobacillus excrementigallinarum]